jgi:signal transduction histidine kinase
LNKNDIAQVAKLLDIAAKYSDNGGNVRLSAQNEGDQVVISVRDRGHGIPPEQLPQMFELFAQRDRLHARSEGGGCR